jgi:hypothetical protein
MPPTPQPLAGTSPAPTSLDRPRSAKSRDSEEANPIPVPTRHRDNAQRNATKYRSGALRRLGITLPQTRNLARITHLLEHADGGVPAVLAALRLVDHPDADKFLACYDALSETDLGHVTIEEISVAAGIGPKRLLEMAVSALVEDSESLGKIIASSYYPKVIQATADCAYLYPDNWVDRKTFLSATGFLPQPANRAGGVFVKNEINLPAVPEMQAGTDDDTGLGPGMGPGPVFNAAEDDLIRLHTTLDGNKLLDAPKTIENASQMQIGHVYRGEDDLECVPVPGQGQGPGQGPDRHRK